MKVRRLDIKVLPVLAFLVISFGVFGVTPGVCMDKGSALSHFNSPFGFMDNTEAEDFYSELSIHWRRPADGRRMGILWNQVESKPGLYDFSRADKMILRSFRKGINLSIFIITVNDNYNPPGRRRRIPYPKGHLKELGRFIEGFVERYDGDGIDDAPSSPVIKLYQFWHELGPPVRRYWNRSNVEEYIEVFKVIYDSMKRVCADCKLLIAGTVLKEDYSFKGEEVYNKRRRRREIVLEDGFLVQVLKGLNRCCPDIGLDYHTWNIPKEGAYLEHKEWIERIRRAYETLGYKNLDIVSMEAGAPDWDGEMEQEQARYLIKSYILSLALGQKRLFWTSSLEYYWPRGPEVYSHTGLINNPRNDGRSYKKLAYYTYKQMVEKLDGAQWGKTRILSMGKDNIYAFQFVKKNKPVYVIWWDYFKEPGLKNKTFTLKDIRATEVRITTATPIAKKGLRVKDYGKAFKIEIRRVDSGKVYLRLDTEPLLVEIRG